MVWRYICMSGSSFGKLFKITTFGESHGGAVGVVVDGAPPSIPITEKEIQIELDRRKPGQSDVSTPRKETDKVAILSGVFEGKTTGTPILMILFNKDAEPEAYTAIKDLFRPGHADFSYIKKYGIRDWRGSGRASGRETAGRVAAGAIAKKTLSGRGIKITAYTLEAAGIPCTAYDPAVIEKNPMRACDMNAAEKMVEKILSIKEQDDSAGGIVECRISGVDAGIGEPVFDKLDAVLSHGILSIGAIKGIEFGTGFRCAKMRGSEHNDEIDRNGFRSNNAGGIIGGITTGQVIVFRAAVKPTASIAKEQQTISTSGRETTISTEGRHDACICPRIVPVVEAMAAIVVEDFIKQHTALKI
jgi:chorismate synthase